MSTKPSSGRSVRRGASRRTRTVDPPAPEAVDSDGEPDTEAPHVEHVEPSAADEDVSDFRLIEEPSSRGKTSDQTSSADTSSVRERFDEEPSGDLDEHETAETDESTDLSGPTVGERLARARRDRGMTLDEVSATTRIRAPVLARIERDDFSRCGGEVYARGHLRSLARLYHLDEAPLLARYTAQQGASADEQEADPNRYVPHRALPSMERERVSDGLLAGLRVTVRRGGRRPAGAERPTTVPPGVVIKPPKRRRGDRENAQAERRGPNWTALMGVALALLIAAFVFEQVAHSHHTGAPAPHHQHHAATPASTRSPATPGNKVSPSQSPSPSVTPTAAVTVRISVVGSASWVGVTNAAGNSLFDGILQPGASHTFSDSQEITISVGNAGAVLAVVNGTSVGALGSDGESLTTHYGPGQPSTAPSPASSPGGTQQQTPDVGTQQLTGG